MPRFHCDLPLSPGRQVELPVEAARHAVGALRLRDGDPVTLFNGDGAEYPATLELRGKAVFARITGCLAPRRESPLAVILAQGISSGERMDLTLQKAVELGVTALHPLMMRRTVVRLSDDKAERRLRHWRGVVVAACEQCGRNHVPPLAPVADALAWLRSGAVPEASRRFILDPEGEARLGELTPPTGPILLWAGPEGGFDPVERQAASNAGFVGLRLGPRVLRTETAALAAVAALQARWGDFL